MADSTTPVYGYVSPEVGASDDTWGAKLNANWLKTDNLLGGTTPVTGIDINGGTVDGTQIGASAASTVVGTTVTATNFVGPIAGAVTGNVTGNTAGVHTGAVTGDVAGNVTANTGTSTFNHVTIAGSLDMDAGTSATITGLSNPVQNSDAATKAYVDTAVANLIDNAPANLDTLNELAAALGDDEAFATTIAASVATKLPKAGGTMTGAIAMGTNKITGLGTPSAGTDAATKAYADSVDTQKLDKAGGTMSGVLAMGANKITGVSDPTQAQDASTKNYTDTLFGSTADAATSAAAAATSAGNSATSATNSGSSATAAANSATAAAASFDSFDDRYLGAKSANPSVDNDGNALITGALYFNSTANSMRVYNGSSWADAGSAVNGTSQRVVYTATASQTSFSVVYDAGFVDVYLNGIKLQIVVDYAATSGTAIVLATGATVGDIVDIVSYGAFNVANTYTQAQADAKYAHVANNLSDLASAATARTNLGVVIGTDVLAPNGSGANLTGIMTSSTLGTLTKTFQSNETATINLTSAVSPTPVVGVTKEVSQVGASSKGSWDVSSTGDNYTLQNTATAVTLTPSSATANGTFTLGSGSFAAADVGKKITGNSGEAILTSTAGAYVIVTPFANTNAIASGSWQMYALKIDTTNGITLNSVIQGYSVSSAAYNSKNFNGGSTGATHLGIFFKPDGLSMYHVSNANDMRQWTLSTAWDISTLSYANKSFDVTAQDSGPQDVFFKPDGLKMFMLGKTNDRVYRYSLSTAWDISTMSYDSSYFSTASQETTPHSLQFKSDGTKMYVAGESSNKMHQYSLSTAWDLSTVSYDSVYFANTAQNNTQLLCTVLSTDGTKLFALNEGGKTVFKYNLSTAWNIGTASYANESFLLSSQDNTPTAIAFKDDGTRMYMVGTTNNIFFQYTTESVSAPAGKYHPAITAATGQIDSQYWTDINTMTADQIAGNGTVSYAVSTDNHAIWKIAKNGVGIRSIARNNSGTWQYNSAFDVVGYNLAIASYDSKSFSVASQEGGLESMAFKPDGTKMYVVGEGNDTIFQYSLSTAWDISTASYASKSFSIASQELEPTSLAFKSDGTKVYVLGFANDSVFQYSLSTAWDISTGSYDSVSFSVTSQEPSPQALFFKPDGTKMYVTGEDNDNVYQYSLSTAWDMSTASYASKSFSIASQEANVRALTFKSDGTKMYVAGQATDTVYQYGLSTAWDVSTGSYDSVSFSIASQNGTPKSLFFKSDGSKMFMAGGSPDVIYQYTTGSENFTTSETWVNGTVNNELATIQQSLNATAANVMDKAQLDAVVDANQFTVGDTLDLMVAPYMATASASLPSSDGVSINYDAAALNKGAILGTDYDYDFPASNKVRITSLASQNLKVRVV